MNSCFDQSFSCEMLIVKNKQDEHLIKNSMPQNGFFIDSKNQLKVVKQTLYSQSNNDEICCRICLEQMGLSQVFSACLCRGTNGQVHENCLLEWAKKAQKYKLSFNKYFYHCQICKQRIYLQVDTKTRFVKWKNIQFFDQQRYCTFSSFLILILGLGMLAVGLYLKITFPNNDTSYLPDLTLGLSGCIIAIDLIVSVLYFILDSELTVTGIVGIPIQNNSLQKKQVKNAQNNQMKNGKSRSHVQNIEIKNTKTVNPLNQTQTFLVEDNVELPLRRFQFNRNQTNIMHSGRQNQESEFITQNSQIPRIACSQRQAGRQVQSQTASLRPSNQLPIQSQNPANQHQPQSYKVFKLQSASNLKSEFQPPQVSSNWKETSEIRPQKGKFFQKQDLTLKDLSSESIRQLQATVAKIKNSSAKARGYYKNIFSMNASNFSQIQKQSHTIESTHLAKNMSANNKAHSFSQIRKFSAHNLTANEIILLRNANPQLDNPAEKKCQQNQDNLGVHFSKIETKSRPPHKSYSLPSNYQNFYE